MSTSALAGCTRTDSVPASDRTSRLRWGRRRLHGPRLGDFACAKRLHRVTQSERACRLQVDPLANRAIAVEIQRDVVRSRLDVQPLEDPVEVVDDTGIVAVDVDLGLARRHLQPDRRAAVIVALAVRDLRIPVERPVVRTIERVVIEGVVERIVIRAPVTADHDNRARARRGHPHGAANTSLSVSVTAPENAGREDDGERRESDLHGRPPMVYLAEARRASTDLSRRNPKAKAEADKTAGGNGCAVAKRAKNGRIDQARLLTSFSDDTGLSARGSNISKTAPPSLRAEIDPPCRSTIAFTIDSPRPLPPDALREASAL